MSDIKRRRFLEFTSVALGSVATTACGGGAGGSALADAAPVPSPAPAPTPSPSPSPTPSPAPVPAPPSTGKAQFTLGAASSGTAPFTLGFAFRMGDIPAGRYVASTLANSQAYVQNRWPDGSAKIAVVSGSAPLVAGTPLTVTLSATTAAPTGTALATADLKATSITAGISCGAFGSASWAGTDWDAPFQTWVTGPQMSSWVYRKPIGSDPFLVGFLEVRLYAGGAVEVLPWIENGYLKVAAPTSKAATYTFTLGGTQRFSAAINLPSQCRTPLISGTALSYWLASDPGVGWVHDKAYLQSTYLVPTYSAVVPNSAGVVGALVASYTPLQQGNFSYDGDQMGGPGYQEPIGLLPQHDVLYLTANSGAEMAAVVRNGFSAGRYPVQYRDETTNRPPKFSSYPHLSANASSTNDMVPAGTGTSAPPWDIPHHPSMGFMAYLVTGRWYFMEQVQFVATTNYLYSVDVYRSFAQGLFSTDHGPFTPRGAAWALRTLLQATHATPDGDALQSELVTCLQNNINFFYNTYVGQPNNPFGLLAPYVNYGNIAGMYTNATWMEDFLTAAFGYTLKSNPPISAAAKSNLQAFFAWKAQSVVGRLGTTAATDWLYADATPYTMVVAEELTPDFLGGTGPWAANWGALYKDTYGTPNPGVDPGLLRGGNFPDGTSYWGNMLPAICYAVDLGAPGAAAAYARMTNASNWSQLTSTFAQAPVWSVRTT